MKFKFLVIVCFLVLASSNDYALSDEVATDTLYQQLRSAESMWQLEFQSTTVCGPGSGGFYCETENSKEFFRLRAILEKRATAGDGQAAFYMGNVITESHEHDSKKSEYSTEEYEKVISYYKKACASKIFTGCWNVGSIYLNGYGEIKSGLAAAEWFYKAGVGYISVGERERALSALEVISGIDPKHALGKKLRAQLQKKAP